VRLEPSDLETLGAAMQPMIRELLREELASALPSRREARPVEPLVLTLEDAAALLSMSKRSVERLVSEGVLPSVKLDARVRIARRDVERLIEQRKEAPRRKSADP
jgi:excisionase family DNA binding protein